MIPGDIFILVGIYPLVSYLTTNNLVINYFTLQRPPRLIKFSLEVIFAMAILLLSVFLFSIIADEMVIEKENAWDMRVFHILSNYTTNSTLKFAQIVTNFGTGYVLIPAYVCIIIIQIRKNNNSLAIIIGVIAVVSLLSGAILKNMFHRPRPLSPFIDGVLGFSFPSGHSLAGFTFSGVLMYLLYRTSIPSYLKWCGIILLSLFGCLIGLSRIFLRVHYASDVVASFLITIVWLSVSFILLKKINTVN